MCSTLRLTVRYPNQKDPVDREVPVPQSVEELKTALGVDSGQTLLVAAHDRHPDQSYMVERVEQLTSGTSVKVQIPRRRIYISVPPDIRRKAVVWYPGATVEQIERDIAKAAGFPTGTPVELRDREVSVVLSVSIPNDTHLEVCPYAPAEPSSRRRGAERPSSAVAPVSSAPASASEAPPPPAGLGRASSKSIQSSSMNLSASQSNRSVGGPGGSSPAGRRPVSPPPTASGKLGGPSPARGRASVTSVGGSTTPAVTQSAPEEHCVHILAGHSGHIFTVCSVGDILFTGSQDSNIMIWDLNNLQYIGTLSGHKGFVKCLTASYAKKALCSGSQDRTIRVWSLDSFSTVKTLYGHTGGVNAVLILEGADALVSGSEDRSIRVWDLTTYDVVACVEQAHLGGVFALEKFGNIPCQVVSGARDRSLKVWDSTTWQITRTLHPPHYDGVTSIAVAGKHGKFYSGSRDRSIKEWDVGALSNTMHTLHVHGDWVQALCMSPSDDVLFSGSRDSTVKVWDGELQCQDVLQGHRGPVSALCTVGNRLFSASHDRTVRVWRIEQYG